MRPISVMPKPYSYDLRQKVIEAIKLNGMKRWVLLSIPLPK
ncbi:MAG: hypothetical protein V7L25_01130 [Nostoc sp.]